MRRAAVAGALVVAAPLVAFRVYHAPKAALTWSDALFHRSS